jgi:hypothetical protein
MIEATSTTTAATEALAEVLLNGETYHIDALEALKPLLAPTVFADVCAAMEVCPTHLCDIQICLDDADDCIPRITDAEASRE